MNSTRLRSCRRAALAWLLALSLAFGLNPGLASAQETTTADSAGIAVAQSSTDARVANFELYGAAGSASIVSVPLTEWNFEEGATAADMTKAIFAAAGINADMQETEYGFYLASITASDGTVYAWDEASGSFWGLYVNGVSSEVGASSVVLKPGDTVSWYYGPYAETLPSQHPNFAPDAPLTDYEATWASYAGDNAGVAAGDVPIIERSAMTTWMQKLLRSDGAYANMSDLLVIGDLVYVAESDSVWGSGTSKAVLNAYRAETGEPVKTMELPYAIDSTCRMAYTEGVIAIPTSGGGLLGVAADTLLPRWYVAPTLDSAQGLNKVAVHDGYFVHSYAQLDADWKASQSVSVAVNAKSGSLKWSLAAQTGSYWSGAAFVGDVAVFGTDAGTLRTVDFATGEVLAEEQVAEAASVRSVPVVSGEDEVVFTTSDGYLVKASVDAKGAIKVLGRVQFAASSTSTPSLVDGVAVVGGAMVDHAGLLAEVDLATMEVTTAHAVSADVKSAPVIGTGADGASYAYFTCNGMPGALFGLRLGSAEAEPFVVCEPDAMYRNYCMASAVSDGAGHLFYTNDAGMLFAIAYDACCGYTDVAPDDWYVQDGLLERAVAADLIGRGSLQFRPWDTLSRAEALTVIYRAAGEPDSSAGAGFVDVAPDAWYADAVRWAQANGVATGYDDGSGRFGPNDRITREQLATMLANYAQKIKGVAIDEASAEAFNGFSDCELTADWARTGMVWCCANGIITGSSTENGLRLLPQDGADRAMMAKMILLTVEAVA